MVDAEMVKAWSAQFSQCSIVILGAGPPCQGVSGLNCDRKGALRDERSSLFVHVARIRNLLRHAFPWCPVHSLMESVRSMDQEDRDIMTGSVGDPPLTCDAGTFTLCHRPRLYWLTWEIPEDVDAQFVRTESGLPPTLVLTGHQDPSQCLRRGWSKVNTARPFPTFTTSRPRDRPGRKPAGLGQCTDAEVDRWIQDRRRFPPYQYSVSNCLMNLAGEHRLPDVEERECILGFPLGYTAPCANKSNRRGEAYNDCRLTLLGNTWSVPVVAYLLGSLLWQLGMTCRFSVQDILDSLTPGTSPSVGSRLVRLPLNTTRKSEPDASYKLAQRLGNLISLKGEDIMLNTPTSQQAKHHRLRASIPSKLWRWRVVAGWKWTRGNEHINALELRAIFTTLRWRVEHVRHHGTRLIHLTDSLVCLHALTRGRSSSRKLRRTMARINALVLVSNLQPVWGYVDTSQNSADRPSRWGRRIRTKFRNAAKAHS